MTTKPAFAEPGSMRQYAPYPKELEALISQLRYKPGWSFELADFERDILGGTAGGLTFVVLADTPDAYHEDVAHRRVYHYFAVPAATYDARSWRRWLLEQLLKVELHEACEFFCVGADRPYAPHHGPGRDPYCVVELGSELEQRTSSAGTLNP